jgi:hypothetical protein
MANEVYANGMELACKAGKGKSICAFPDVCFTPPQTPATPPGVPIPYPNTGMASDTTSGSKTVMISNKEVMLKNKSYFKKSMGDEAGSAPKKGVITSTNRGKVYFNAWSMDVKYEGENVVRHLDITTHNHASPPGNTPPWPFMDFAALGSAGSSENPCVKSGDAQKVKDNCKSPPQNDFSNKCCDARKCVLVPYSPNKCCSKGKGKKKKQMTPHHVVPKSQFKKQGKGGAALTLASGGTYNPNKAPCICADGSSHSTGKHGDIHTETNNLTVNHDSVKKNVTGKTISADARWEVSESEEVGAKAVSEVTKCDEACIKAQTRAGHADMNIEPNDQIRPTTAGSVTKPPPSTTPSFS